MYVYINLFKSFGHRYSGTSHNGHPSTTAICDIMANSPDPLNYSSTMEPLYNSQNIYHSPTVAAVEGFHCILHNIYCLYVHIRIC